MPLSSIEQLDAVINYLYDINDDKDLAELEVYFMEETQQGINNRDLKRIVIKLKDEKYLDWHTKARDPEVAGGLFYISFDGKFLKETGGYANKIKE